MNRHQKKRLYTDLAIILISIAVAVILLKSGAVEHLLLTTGEVRVFGNFLAGALFTSTFTIAPATVALLEIGKLIPPLEVALVGGLGAAVGDFIIFLFLRNRLAEDLRFILRGQRHLYETIVGRRFFRFLTPLLGALIIASPLPDEIGLAILGFSRLGTSILLPVSFLANAVGIFIVAAVGRFIG